MGNTDRHLGNLYVGVKADGGLEMIGIDHGYAFPNSQREYRPENGNQADMFKLAKPENVSSEFKKNLKT
jgi:hypothetical protein